MYHFLEDKEFIQNMRRVAGEIMQMLCHDLKVEYDELLEEFNDWQEKYEAKDMVNWRQQEIMADEMYERKILGEI